MWAKTIDLKEERKEAPQKMAGRTGGRGEMCIARQRLHSLIDEGISDDGLRNLLREMEGRKSGERNQLPGDRQR